MDPVLYAMAFTLGLIEGITEFLPVSSTGHLIVAGELIGYDSEQSIAFKIAIQLGAILAVVWAYWGRLFGVACGLFSDVGAQRFVVNLCIAFLPAALLGLLLHEHIVTHLFSPITVAVALILGGVAILIVERLPHRVRIETVDAMRPLDALKIGLAQSLALIPGTSRSGATIIGGLLFGLSRPAVTEFSFFLAIPTMFAATLYSIYDDWALLGKDDFAMIATGLIAAFFSALVAVRGLLRYIARHSFAAFGWYRIGFGLLVLVWFS